MRFQFLHVSDVHLGYEQYGSKERSNDFAKAFWSIIKDAITRKVDFVIVPGDLFNKRSIDAMTLIQAQMAFQDLKDAGIPALVIEGNHDRNYYRDGLSWLKFLAWQKLIYLLDPIFEDGKPVFEEWNQEVLRGAYVTLCDGKVRVYGVPWMGANTGHVVDALTAELARQRPIEDAAGVEYRILLMHTGVEGIIPRMNGLPTLQQLKPLQNHIDYLALGHVHKKYIIEDWIYNPGSPETWGAEESAWANERGYFVVQVDTSTSDVRSRQFAQHFVNNRRAFYRYTFRVDGLEDPESLYSRFESFCRKEARSCADAEEPVVEVSMNGILNFDSASLERSRLEEMVKTYFKPLIARVINNTTNPDFEPEESELDGRDQATRRLLELHVFQDLLSRDVRFLNHQEEWSKVAAGLKHMAQQGDNPADIARWLKDSQRDVIEGKSVSISSEEPVPDAVEALES